MGNHACAVWIRCPCWDLDWEWEREGYEILFVEWMIRKEVRCLRGIGACSVRVSRLAAADLCR